MKAAGKPGPEQHVVVGYGAAVHRVRALPGFALLHVRQRGSGDGRTQQYVPIVEECTPGTTVLHALLVKTEPCTMRHVDTAEHDRISAHVVRRAARRPGAFVRQPLFRLSSAPRGGE